MSDSQTPAAPGVIPVVRRPFRSVSQVFATNLVDFGLKFITSVIIARSLGPEDKGVLTFATLVVGWVTMFGNLSLADATVYLVGRGAFSMAEAFVSVTVFSLSVGLLYAGVLFGVVSFGLVHWPTSHVHLFVVLLSMVPLGLLVGNLIPILQAAQRFKAYAAFTILRSGAMLIATVVAVKFAPNRLEGIAAAMILATLLAAVLAGALPGAAAGAGLAATRL